MLLNVRNEQVYGVGTRIFSIRQEGARVPPCSAHGSVEPISRERSEREAPRKFSLSFLFFAPLLYSPGLPWGIPWQGNLLPKAPPLAANPLAMTLLPSRRLKDVRRGLRSACPEQVGRRNKWRNLQLVPRVPPFPQRCADVKELWKERLAWREVLA